MATKRNSRKKKGLLGNLNLERIGAVAAGAAGAKMLNAPLNSLVEKYGGEGGGKMVKMIVPAIKGAAGIYLMGQKNQMVADAGLGMTAIGALELVDQLFPSLSISGGLGYIDDMERVGEVIEIDLNELAPGAMNGARGSLDAYHEVAGAGYVTEEMELAGVW